MAKIEHIQYLHVLNKLQFTHKNQRTKEIRQLHEIMHWEHNTFPAITFTKDFKAIPAHRSRAVYKYTQVIITETDKHIPHIQTLYMYNGMHVL